MNTLEINLCVPENGSYPSAKKPLSINWCHYGDYAMASAASSIMERMTGDRCRIIRFNFTWSIIRLDREGREAEQ